MLSKTINLKTFARHFEEEYCSYIWRLKLKRLIKWKGYLFALENKGKLAFFVRRPAFSKANSVLKMYTDFKNLRTVYGKLIFSFGKNLPKVYKLVIGNHCPFKFENCWLDSRLKMARLDRVRYCFKPSTETISTVLQEKKQPNLKWRRNRENGLAVFEF